MKHLFANLLWLAKHRLRHLVADWRHRTLKRITGEDGMTASFPGSFWDWTPPGLGPTPNLPGRAPKNITVRGDPRSTTGGLEAPRTTTRSTGSVT